MWRIIIFAVLLGAVAGYRTQGYIKPADKIKEDSPITTISTLASSSLAANPSTIKTTKTTAAPPTTTTTTTTAATTTAQTTRAPEIEPSSEASSSSSPLTTPADQAVSSTPEFSSELPPDLTPIDNNENTEQPNRRRVITYDQRQEGQYNIRADLENFMIVLIPPSPMDGMNLLDLLTKSAFRRSSVTHAAKAKRRHPYAETAAAERFHQSLRTGNKNQNFNYFERAAVKGANELESPNQHYRQADDLPYSVPKRFQEFIEGRSPFLVDLALTRATEHTRLHPDRQVDVLPPHYPLAYQHLITPFHLEAEPTVIQALPPTGIAGQSSQGANNFLETYNQLLAASNLQDNNDEALQVPPKSAAPQESDFYRVSRAIRGDSLLDTNSLGVSNSLLSGSSDASLYRRSSNLPIYRSDLAFGTASLYPPIDAPRLSGYLNVGSTSRTLSLNSGEERDLDDAHVGEIIVPSPSGDELDFDLNNGGFLDSEVKSLLSDGLERCAPGRRRDSYGVCREIEGY